MKKIISNILIPSHLKRKATFIFFDILAFTAALLLAFEIRFEFNSPQNYAYDLFPILVVFIAIKLGVYFYYKLYDITWRFISLHDLANIAKACLLSNGILFIMIYGLNIDFFMGFPRSVLVVDLILSIFFSAGIKISKRMYFEVMRVNIGKSALKRTVIVGAGNAGEQLIRDINRSQNRELVPVCFLDDDTLKQNIYVQGIKVLGTTEDLPSIIRQFKIECVIIAVLSADGNFNKKIFKIARENGIYDVKVVSTINDTSNLIQVGVRDIKDIDVCDLIGRQAVSINTKEISGYTRGKRILITGAAGSIGSEIARQVLFYHPTIVGILDINESDLTALEQELKYISPGTKINMFLCDISNKDKVNRIFEEFRPDVVFHAAAYKHVPVMEKFPEEGVRVNVVGTYNLSMAAVLFGCTHFVMISTDKAVNPSSIMGVTKRIAEMIVTGTGYNSNSHFVAVRFGNVIGSRGSVLPIFLEQIKRGGPITITHPEMKRYFMTTSESVALVLQAAATGKNGDVFVLDMGKPVKIVDLAKELILMNNLVPNKDIKLVFTGIREGEKLFEEILTAEEGVDSTRHEKIFKARISNNYNWNIDEIIFDFTNENIISKAEWIEKFRKHVPTFASTSDANIFYLGDTAAASN